MMIECSKCLTWIHLKCAGVRKNNIPETWHCAKCKPPQQKSDEAVDQAMKKVSGSRKRKSTKVSSNIKKIVDVESLDS